MQGPCNLVAGASIVVTAFDSKEWQACQSKDLWDWFCAAVLRLVAQGAHDAAGLQHEAKKKTGKLASLGELSEAFC